MIAVARQTSLVSLEIIASLKAFRLMREWECHGIAHGVIVVSNALRDNTSPSSVL